MTRPTAAELERNVKRAYVFLALVNLSLWMPIWVVFLHSDRHLDLGQVYLIAGFGWIVQAVTEVPSSAMSDAYGRRVTLVVGCATVAVGLVLLAMLDSFAGLMVAYVCWAVGLAIISGSDRALLYDSAAALRREDDFPRLASLAFQVTLGAQAVGSIAGGLLGTIDLRIPILVTAASTLGAALTILRTREPAHRESADSTCAGTIRTATAYVKGHPRILALILFGAVLSGTAFFIPFVLFQPAMQEQGVGVGWLGVLFTGLRLASIAGSRYGPELVPAHRLGTWLWLTPTLMALGYLAVAGSGLWWTTYIGMMLVTVVNSVIRPAIEALLNQRITASVRATINSLQSLLMTVFIALLHSAAGAIADHLGIAAAFVLLAVLCVLPVALAIPTRGMTTGRESPAEEPVRSSQSGG